VITLNLKIMNKIISTISIVTIIISIVSCRQQDGDFVPENYTTEKSALFGRENDSIAISDSINAVNQPIPGDPPPKNGHQWRP